MYDPKKVTFYFNVKLSKSNKMLNGVRAGFPLPANSFFVEPNKKGCYLLPCWKNLTEDGYL